jgi:hypothetical protein
MPVRFARPELQKPDRRHQTARDCARRAQVFKSYQVRHWPEAKYFNSTTYIVHHHSDKTKKPCQLEI